MDSTILKKLPKKKFFEKAQVAQKNNNSMYMLDEEDLDQNFLNEGLKISPQSANNLMTKFKFQSFQIPSTPSSSSSSTSSSAVNVVTPQLHTDVNYLRAELEAAQETNGYLILSENNKMTEIDKLKDEIQQQQKRIEELEKKNN